MFTGIVEEVGQVISLTKQAFSGSVTISASVVLEDIHLGDSIAVNGVCLTVSSFASNCFAADVMGETMRRTNLGFLKAGSFVNLERAMSASGRFGGHIVSGHIDGTGKILEQKQEENAVWLTIGAKENICRYIVEKGSIAMDGVSLTVAAINKESFQVSIIPHTRQETTLLKKKNGELVNLECDVMGKYVEKLLLPYGGKQIQSRITSDFLVDNGFL